MRGVKVFFAFIFACALISFAAFAEEGVYHSVTFVVDDAPHFQQMVMEGECVIVPEPPFLEGAEFVGWFDDRQVLLTDKTFISEDAIFTAEFRFIGKRAVVIEYLDESGQTVAPRVLREYAGDEDEKEQIASPHIDGMVPGQAIVTVASKALAEDSTTITVLYKPLSGPYTIHRHFETFEDSEYEYNSALDAASDAFDPADAPAGFTFLYVTEPEAAQDGSVAARAYYGRNVHLLSFDAQGGTPILPATGKYAQEMTLPSTDRKGYRLEGWYFDAEYSVPAGAPGDAFLMPIDNETTLFAKWTSRTVPYTVVSWLSKPDASDQYAYFSKRTLSALAGEVILENAAERIDIDADFVSSTSAEVLGDGSGVIHAYYSRREAPMADDGEEKTSYALTFNTLGTPDNADVPGAQTVLAGQSLSGLAPDSWDDSVTMTVDGIPYTFGGWHRADGYDPVDFERDTMPRGDLELFAKWTRGTVTVQLSLNYEGAQTASPIKIPAGSVIASLLPENVSPEGYTFTGWYLDAACEQEFDANVPVFADMALFAGHEKLPVSYTVYYLNERGEAAAPPKKVINRAVGATVSEQAPIIPGMRPGAAICELTLSAADEENSITFHYTKVDSVSYTASYGYYTDTDVWVELSDEARFETEAGRAVVWAKDILGYYPLEKFHCLQLVSDEAQNTIRFEYVPYVSVAYTIHHTYFDGEAYIEDTGALKQGAARIGETVMDGEKVTDKHVFLSADPVKYFAVAADSAPIEITYEYGYGRGSYQVEFYYRDADGNLPAAPNDAQTRDQLFDSEVSVTDEDKLPTKAGYVLDEAMNADYVGVVTVGEPLALKVYFRPDFSMTTVFRYTVEHVCVDAGGREVIETLASFPNVAEYWSGYDAAILTKEKLKDDQVYPGFVFLSDDERLGSDIEDGATYYVRYSANYEDTQIISFMVNHVAKIDDGAEMMFAAIPVEQTYWVGGPTPELTGDMLRSDAAYPGYRIIENEPRLLEKVENGAVYTVTYAPDYDDVRTISYTVRHIGLSGDDTKKMLSELSREATYWRGGEAPALTEEMLNGGEEHPGYIFTSLDDQLGLPVTDGGVYEVMYAANYDDIENIAYTVTHIARGDEQSPEKELAVFEETLAHWRGDDPQALTAALLKADLSYPGYALEEMDGQLGEAVHDASRYSVWYAPNYEDTEPLRATVTHAVVDDQGALTSQVLNTFTLYEDYWRGGAVPVLLESMLDKPEAYPGYVLSEDDPRIGETLQNGETYMVKYQVNLEDAIPITYSIVHTVPGDEGKTLGAFEDTIDVWNGGAMPTLSAERLRQDAAYPGYTVQESDARIGQPIEDGAVYTVTYARNDDDVDVIAYTVQHAAGDTPLGTYEGEARYWRGGEPATLNADVLMSDKHYPGFAHQADDARVGEALEEGALYHVTYQVNPNDQVTAVYTVRHIGVDQEGNQIGSALYEFTAEEAYWSGGEAPALTGEMLKADQAYPGFDYQSMDERTGTPLESGAAYVVTYIADFSSTAPLNYAVEHITSGDDTKTLARFEETIDAWRGGSAPALTGDMLKKPEGYPGYVFSEDDARVGLPLEDGAVYTVLYEENPEDTMALHYKVNHAIVNSNGNPTGETLGTFEKSAVVWRGGDAPALTLEMLNVPHAYPGYTAISEDERLGAPIEDGAVYIVKYEKNPGDLAKAQFTVAHIAVDEDGSPTDVTLLSTSESVEYWRGGNAPALTIDMLKKPGNGYPGYRFYGNDERVGEPLADGAVYEAKYVAKYDDVQSIQYKVSHIVVDQNGDQIGKPLATFAERAEYWRGGSAPALTDEMLKKPDEYPGYRFVSGDSRVGEALVGGETYLVRYALNEADTVAIHYTVSHIILNPNGTDTGETLLNIREEATYWRGGAVPTLTRDMLKRPERYPGYIYIDSDRRVGKPLEDGETYIVKYAINEKDVETLTFTVNHVTVNGEVLKSFTGSIKYWRGSEAPALTAEMLKNSETYRGYRRLSDDERLGAPLVKGETYIVKYGDIEKVTIRYVARLGGSVSIPEERLNPQIGEARGTAAAPAGGYTFENWTDAAGNVVSTAADFTPVKDAGESWPDGVTYYANFVSDWPEVVSLKGSVSWVGLPEDMVAPTVVIELYQNSGSEPYRAVSVSPGEGGFSFSNLPRRDESGAEYHYTVREIVPDDFTAAHEGYDIVNTYEPGTTGFSVRLQISIPEGKELSVTLLRDGEMVDTKVFQTGNTSARFEGLPKYAPDGHEYDYRPSAENAEINGTMKTGFTISPEAAG